MSNNKVLMLLATAVLVASCKTPTAITYFQDTTDGSETQIKPSEGIAIRKNDNIAVTVYSRDANLANMFNLPYHSFRIGAPSESVQSNYTQGVGRYLVDENGCIDFPVLGKIRIEGQTRSQAAAFIKNQLIASEMIMDPIVVVDFTNNYIVVMGEVVHPGRMPIDRDDYSIFDAVGACGDLTIYGERECVKVMRVEGGTRKTYVLNLCDAASTVSSPAYYLRPDDVVYVSPNRMRKRQSTVNGNNIESVSFWLSVASLLVTISYYFVFSGLIKRS